MLYETGLDASKEFPMYCAFNSSGESFLQLLTCLSKDVGWGNDFCSVSSWSSLDDYDKSLTPKYDGYCFETIDGQSFIISFEDLYKYIDIACSEYVSHNIDATEVVENLKKEYCYRFNIK